MKVLNREQMSEAKPIYSKALRDGEIVRPKTCSACGTPCLTHGHHSDYSKPKEVEWLCPSCHKRRHMAAEGRQVLFGSRPIDENTVLLTFVECSADECANPAHARGLCIKHYQRRRRAKAKA